MGGKRIADQVRRALIAAAKVAPVAVVIDAAGCTRFGCPSEEPNGLGTPFDAAFYGAGGAGGLPFWPGTAGIDFGGGSTGVGGRDGGGDARDAGDGSSIADVSDATKDGG